MEKLLKYCHNRFSKINSFRLVAILTIAVYSCDMDRYDYYNKIYNQDEKMELAEQLVSGMGYRYYRQGSIDEQAIINEAAKYNDQHAEVWRERGIPYLKRGMAADFYEPYNRSIELDPENWLGYRGYCYLYFYRDYKRALDDFNRFDDFTPSLTDFPQSISLDYMRAICHLKLNQPIESLAFINKHILEESEKVGLKFVHVTSFLIKGKAHEQAGEIYEAIKIYEAGLTAHRRNADLAYYLAKIYLKQNNAEKAQHYIQKAKFDFNAGYANSRNYVEEFYQVYLIDIEELIDEIDVKII